MPLHEHPVRQCAIPLVLWLDVLAVGLAAYVIIEVEKWLRRKLSSSKK